MTPRRPGALSRRQMLAGSGLATAALVTGAGLSSVAGADTPTDPSAATVSDTVPFHGVHQAGIATPEQARLAFAAFDVTGSDRDALAGLLATWTHAAEAMTAGRSVEGAWGMFAPPADTGEALGLAPSRLTLTVGFGPTLFDDRFGLADRRPGALIELPAFAGDDLDPVRSGGDLCVQACADDP